MKESSRKYIGVVEVPIKSIQPPCAERALRAINPTHLTSLRKGFRRDYENGHHINFPPAVGYIKEAIDNVEEAQERVCDGLAVELIDGNHTNQIQRELNEDFPSERAFQTRFVIYYEQS